MHIAAANGYIDVIEFLLDNGAKLDVTDKDGWQPVHAAACWGHVSISVHMTLYKSFFSVIQSTAKNWNCRNI